MMSMFKHTILAASTILLAYGCGSGNSENTPSETNSIITKIDDETVSIFYTQPYRDHLPEEEKLTGEDGLCLYTYTYRPGVDHPTPDDIVKGFQRINRVPVIGDKFFKKVYAYLRDNPELPIDADEFTSVWNEDNTRLTETYTTYQFRILAVSLGRVFGAIHDALSAEINREIEALDREIAELERQIAELEGRPTERARTLEERARRQAERNRQIEERNRRAGEDYQKLQEGWDEVLREYFRQTGEFPKELLQFMKTISNESKYQLNGEYCPLDIILEADISV